MKVESESEVAQSYPTLSDPMDCSLPGFSVHGIFQARVLEWGAIAKNTESQFLMNTGLMAKKNIYVCVGLSETGLFTHFYFLYPTGLMLAQ